MLLLNERSYIAKQAKGAKSQLQCSCNNFAVNALIEAQQIIWAVSVCSGLKILPAILHFDTAGITPSDSLRVIPYS